MNKTKNYKAPETEIIELSSETAFLQASQVNGSITIDPFIDGEDY